jgi:hypothetical protein
MKTPFYIIVFVLLLSASCKKDDSPRTSGTATIDNVRGQDYNVNGFQFSTGQIVSTGKTPGPDITVDSTTMQPYRVIFQANNLRSSFHRYGDYPDENAAKTAFNELHSISVTTWIDLADPVLPHQIWLYRSGNDKYSKLRIISIARPDHPVQEHVVEVTFEWVHQPDGSLNFP